MAPNTHRQESGRHFELPVLIFGPVEIHRLSRELETLEDYLQQAAIRDKGKPSTGLPRTSRLLEALAANNALNLLQEGDRKQLAAFLQTIDKSAPIVTISFAADPSAAFTAKVVAWLRTNIHPYALLHLGLQPAIAAGCIVRTNSKVYDLSLRQKFYDQRPLLLSAIGGVGKL